MSPEPAPMAAAAEPAVPLVVPRRRFARFLPLLVVLGLTGAVFALGLDRYATLEALREHHAWLVDFIGRSPALAALAYLGLYVALTALSLPWASLLTVAGGFLFGTALGTGLTVIGATAGATVIFLVTRGAVGEPLSKKARLFLPPGWLERIEAGFRDHALAYMLALRLAPIFPFVAVNLVAAFLAVPLRAYVLGTALGIVPGSIVYALFGAGLGDLVTQPGGADFGAALSPSLIAAFFGMAVLAIIPVLIKRRRRA